MSKGTHHFFRSMQDIQYMLLNDLFLANVNKVIAQFDFIHIPDAEDVYDNWLDSMSANEPILIGGNLDFEREPAFTKATQKILSKYNLSENHLPLLYCFIRYGFIPQDDIMLPNGGNIDTSSTEVDKVVYYKIFPNTTLADIKNDWPTIQSYLGPQRKSITYSSRVKNKLDRDLKIYRLHKDNLSHKQIASIINKESLDSDEVLGYENIGVIVKRVKDEIDRRITA